MLNLILSLFLFSNLQKEIVPDTLPKPVVEYWNWDQHDLPRKAETKAISLPSLAALEIKLPIIVADPNFSNQRQTSIYQIPLIESFLEEGATFELLILNHVNQPVGFELLVQNGLVPYFAATYFNRMVILGSGETHKWEKTEMDIPRWKSYWTHMVITFNNAKAEVFLNGQSSAIIPFNSSDHSQVFLKGFFENEPYMELGDLIKQIRAYQFVLSGNSIFNRFESLKEQIEAGILYPDSFHLNAGPYLNDILPTKAQIVWETDRVSSVNIRYGESNLLEKSIRLEESEALIRQVVLENLKPGSTYYYQISCKSRDGEEIKSPILTFQTSKPSDLPFMFGIISDTESRPQINRRVGKLLWDERPDFLIHLGDLTDGGQKSRKFEWNMEYFQGIGPLVSRIPIATVPGNGDSDLFWYKQFHPHSGAEAYYRFDYGEASFWMLNSNLKKELQKGGSQYNWLSAELKKR
jgi:acid phosphatase type 7